MKRILSVLLSVILVLSLLTTAALAADDLRPGVYTALENGALEGYVPITIDKGAYYAVDYTTGAAKTVYYWQPEAASAVLTDAPAGVTIAPVSGTDYAGLYAVTLPAGMKGTVYVNFQISTGSGECIMFSDGTGGSAPAETIPQHALQPEEKLTDTEGLSIDPAAFTFGGETYYLAPMTLRDRQSMTFRMGGGTSMPPSPATAPWVFCLGIWSFTENEGYTLVDAALRNEILAAFGDSLTMTMYSVRNEESANYPDFAANYPEMTPYDPDGWPCGTEYVFTEDTAGKWLFVAEGTIGDQTLTTGTTFRFEPRKVLTIENPATVEELNEALASFAAAYPAESGYTCDVYLSDAQLTGIIKVPENLHLVCIYGAEGNTTIVGGMDVNSHTIIENLDFVGAGTTDEVQWLRDWDADWQTQWNERYADNWHKTWPEGGPNAGQPNTAVFGKVNILYNNCSFRDFYYAFDNSACINFGGDNSLFENNAVAINFSTADGEAGNLGMTQNVFRGNGAAFRMETLNPEYLPAEYSVLRCQFIDNGADVINLASRRFFLNGSYFAFNGVVGPVCGLSAGDAGTVHSFPYAADPNFSAFDYSAHNAVVLNGQAEDWRIPADQLSGKTVVVLDETDDTTVGTWVFSE